MEQDVNTEKVLRLKEKLSKGDVPFTPKEIEVIILLSGGLSEKEIAARLNMRYRTAKKHIENIKMKTGLSKSTELLGYLASRYNDEKFSLKKLREYGLLAFLIFVHVCKIDV